MRSSSKLGHEDGTLNLRRRRTRRQRCLPPAPSAVAIAPAAPASRARAGGASPTLRGAVVGRRRVAERGHPASKSPPAASSTAPSSASARFHDGRHLVDAGVARVGDGVARVDRRLGGDPRRPPPPSPRCIRSSARMAGSRAHRRRDALARQQVRRLLRRAADRVAPVEERGLARALRNLLLAARALGGQRLRAAPPSPSSPSRPAPRTRPSAPRGGASARRTSSIGVQRRGAAPARRAQRGWEGGGGDDGRGAEEHHGSDRGARDQKFDA